MIPPDRFEQIVRGLLARTRQNQLSWRLAGNGSDSYALDLNNSRITIAFLSPRTEPDLLRIDVRDKREDKSVGEWATAPRFGWAKQLDGGMTFARLIFAFPTEPIDGE